MGSSGGGGGGSGVIDYPDYLETLHSSWLDSGGGDVLSDSITGVMNNALGSSPYTGLNAYDPSVEVAAILAAPDSLSAIITGLNQITTWDALLANASTQIDAELDDEAQLVAAIDAYADILDDQITSDVLPRFEAGMQDINAVMSSAFVVGRALIESSRDRDVAKFSADLRLQSRSAKNQYKMEAIRQMLSVLQLRINGEAQVATMYAEANRISIVANKEQIDQDIQIDVGDGLWDLQAFQYGANVMAAIAGGTAPMSQKGPSQTQSAIGGALTGAVAGASIGGAAGGIGAVPGAVIGGVLGAASSLL